MKDMFGVRRSAFGVSRSALAVDQRLVASLIVHFCSLPCGTPNAERRTPNHAAGAP